MFLRISQNLQENTCARASFLIKLQAEAVAQVFSCKFYEISKNAFFHRTPLVTASELVKKCCCKLFRILQIEYIIYKKRHKKMHCKRFEHSPCIFSGNIFNYDWIWYISSSVDSNELFIWVFSHSIRGWLAGASNVIGCSCNG